MADNQQDTQEEGIYAGRVRGIEEKYNILKDRVLLIGNNLIDTKENTNNEILEMKKDIEKLKESIDRIKDFMETLSNEMSKFAKKEDLEILQKQAKMFQPADFIRRDELKDELDKLKG